MTTETDRHAMTPGLAEALGLLNVAARRVIAHGLVRLPEVHRLQIQKALEANQCALTVQIDIPAGAVRVLADGDGWLAPQVLMALEWNEPETDAVYQ